jgi:hypothetical protein
MTAEVTLARAGADDVPFIVGLLTENGLPASTTTARPGITVYRENNCLLGRPFPSATPPI